MASSKQELEDSLSNNDYIDGETDGSAVTNYLGTEFGKTDSLNIESDNDAVIDAGLLGSTRHSLLESRISDAHINYQGSHPLKASPDLSLDNDLLDLNGCGLIAGVNTELSSEYTMGHDVALKNDFALSTFGGCELALKNAVFTDKTYEENFQKSAPSPTVNCDFLDISHLQNYESSDSVPLVWPESEEEDNNINLSINLPCEEPNKCIDFIKTENEEIHNAEEKSAKPTSLVAKLPSYNFNVDEEQHKLSEDDEVTTSESLSDSLYSKLGHVENHPDICFLADSLASVGNKFDEAPISNFEMGLNEGEQRLDLKLPQKSEKFPMNLVNINQNTKIPQLLNSKDNLVEPSSGEYLSGEIFSLDDGDEGISRSSNNSEIDSSAFSEDSLNTLSDSSSDLNTAPISFLNLKLDEENNVVFPEFTNKILKGCNLYDKAKDVSSTNCSKINVCISSNPQQQTLSSNMHGNSSNLELDGEGMDLQYPVSNTECECLKEDDDYNKNIFPTSSNEGDLGYGDFSPTRQEILPTFQENTSSAEEKGDDIDIELEFNLQNSPMLRRSRVNNVEGRERRDCRLLFNDEISASDSEETSESDDEKFKSIRDSIDIAKRCQFIISEEEGRLEVAEDDLSKSSLSDFTDSMESLDYASPSYQTKPFSCKKKKLKGKDLMRRVSFPNDDMSLITSYLEPVNPWFHMVDVCTDDISKAYLDSCAKHKTQPLPIILQQIVALPLGLGERIECLSMINVKLEAGQCECLEEVFRRVQFQTLAFENCDLDDDTSIPLFDMIEFYDSAVHVNISSNTKISNRGWQACGKMIKRTSSLRSLEARNSNLSEQNMPIFCKSLRIGSRLHTLHLEKCTLSGRPLGILAGALRFNDSITDLFLADNCLGGNDAIPLGNLIRSSRTLKVLDLRNNNIQDTGCGYICKDIAEQQSLNDGNNDDNKDFPKCGLTMLVLWNNHITLNSVPYLSLMLSSNKTIETLNLGMNAITSEGILMLKNSLIRNKVLVRLGLQATRIGNEGAVALAECIADNKVLARIDLRENKVQLAGLLALSMSLKINETVVQLDIDSNPKSEPSSELSDQHLSLHREIKTLCQRNLKKAHMEEEGTFTASFQDEEVNFHVSRRHILSPEKRKISLTCETIFRPHDEENLIDSSTTTETKRYWSPDPSPCVSPCPSPSMSPSLSPVPSPLKNNRFRVFKVKEEGSASLSPTVGIHPGSSPSLQASFSSSLPTSLPSSRPNRFSSGGRFTVTKVADPSLLACSRVMSSPSLIVPDTNTKGTQAPTIVVSSPHKAVRGFSVEEEMENLCDRVRSNSLELPSRSMSTSSDSDSSLQDDVFSASDEPVDPPNSYKTSETVDDESNANFTQITNNEKGTAPREPLLIQKAPLACTEVGSFDTDSEDSELATQSSDSTRSDEIRVADKQSELKPMSAWKIESNAKDGSETPQKISEEIQQ